MNQKTTSIVQLKAAKIPYISRIAVHYWFVISQNFNNQTKIERWEIWQKANAGPHSWGHLHKNLLPPQSGVGCGDSWVEKQWTGAEAEILSRIIQNSPHSYQHKHLYRYWPGPNSNTYIQWVLRQAKINYLPGPLGIGKDYLGLVGFKRYNKIIHFSSPLIGLKFNWPTEFEIHLLTLSFGLSIKPFSFKTPFGIYHLPFIINH